MQKNPFAIQFHNPSICICSPLLLLCSSKEQNKSWGFPFSFSYQIFPGNELLKSNGLLVSTEVVTSFLLLYQKRKVNLLLGLSLSFSCIESNLSMPHKIRKKRVCFSLQKKKKAKHQKGRKKMFLFCLRAAWAAFVFQINILHFWCHFHSWTAGPVTWVHFSICIVYYCALLALKMAHYYFSLFVKNS